ncbi:MAG TPA: DEAD/DEAH box helicase, partial [Burkholderiales bacterium]|nr:DEAD/DEAH box helicase [Burkholderiales bacterium]
MAVLQIALDVPLPRLFDYSYPDASAAMVGKRVVVPFGRGRKLGVVIAVAATSDVAADKLREAEEVLEDMPALSSEWLALSRFCSDYYQRPLGEVLHAALPPRLRRPLALNVEPQTYAITAMGHAALTSTKLRSPLQRELLRQLAATPLPAAALPATQKRQLLQNGWIEPSSAPLPTIALSTPYCLTPAQQKAVQAIQESLGSFAVQLLLGVTGSGKTEVYLHAIAATLGRRQQVLMLVPEINLTPHLEAQLRTRLPGVRLVTLTSASADKERARGWLAAQSGQADIVLGTRLAVFAPLPDVGLVIVDEEHDSSFKQQEGVRY